MESNKMNANILVVEDEEKLARFIELELTHEGYAVRKAADGRAALGAALSEETEVMDFRRLTKCIDRAKEDAVFEARSHTNVRYLIVAGCLPMRYLSEISSEDGLKEADAFNEKGMLAVTASFILQGAPAEYLRVFK